LRLVNSDYQVAGDEETVFSRVEYENKQREKDILLERVQELRARIEWLAKEKNILEQAKGTREEEDKAKGGEVLELINDLKVKILEGRLEMNI